MAKKHTANSNTKLGATSHASTNSVPRQGQANVLMPAFISRHGLVPYLPGMVLFIFALIIGLITFKDYGVAWDEPAQRLIGELSYNYIFNGDQSLFTRPTDNHGAGYELLLILLEKWFNLTDSREIYLMRHLVTHILFLLSAFSLYVLAYKLYTNKWVASLGFLMLAFAPRLYAHSFFNSKDIPFLCFVVFSFTLFQSAFSKYKPLQFLLLGLVVGYATSIRIMGVMFVPFVFLFLVVDQISYLIKREKNFRPASNFGAFLLGFCILLFASWPYLWHNPIHNFVESFARLSNFDLYNGINLFNGNYVRASKIGWQYFPTWFFISSPEVWLLSGFGGIIITSIMFVKKPSSFLANPIERNLLFYLLCFFVPIVAVIAMHSVIYDDWRHLYFVYPPFIMLALYLIDKLFQTKYHYFVKAICGLQFIFLGFFMFGNHPFHQVYFNNFVAHSTEGLHTRYELEYWGCGFKQGLEYLVKAVPSGAIAVNSEFKTLVDNNIMVLPENERGRIQFVDYSNADYLITNYREHAYPYPSYSQIYSASVLNSTILSVFKLDKDPPTQQVRVLEEIGLLKSVLSYYPGEGLPYIRLGDMYAFCNLPDSAIKHYARALQLSPSEIKVCYALAQLYFRQKQFAQSIVFNKKALVLDPGYIYTYANVGLAYLHTGQYDSAIHYSNKARVMDARFPAPYEILATAYNKIGITDSANKFDAIARQNNPGYKLLD